MFIVEEYQISLNTMAILPYRHPQHQTRILDVEGEFITSVPARELLNNGCLDDSSTYDGRRVATIHFTNYIQKTPILVNQAEAIIAIPTHSPDQPACSWLFLHHLKHVTEISPTRCLLTFKNYTEIELEVSAMTIYEQVKKATVVYARFCSGQLFTFLLNPKVKKGRKRIIGTVKE